MVTITTNTKRCSRCEQRKLLEEFNRNQHYCRVCQKDYTDDRERNQPDKICSQCNKIFKNRNNKVKYCSYDCYWDYMTGREGSKPKNRITRFCEWCDSPVIRPASNFHAEKIFCNYSCMAQYQSKYIRQKNHPRWKGGHSRGYSLGWNKAREKIMIRSGGKCEICGISADHIHHRIPRRLFKKHEDANIQANLLHLCSNCHINEHKKLRKHLHIFYRRIEMDIENLTTIIKRHEQMVMELQ